MRLKANLATNVIHYFCYFWQSFLVLVAAMDGVLGICGLVMQCFLTFFPGMKQDKEFYALPAQKASP